MDFMNLSADTASLIALSSLVTIVAVITGGFWKAVNWLRDKFEEVEHHLEKILDTHEEKDQVRHEDNIQRFSVIETQLTTLIKNGTH
ncbi:MAG: hypothetical protein KGI25_07960 [Thaumarchaeota archaeon]|nr:hypothetical protein [Nitrososphaerota archaeon]